MVIRSYLWHHNCRKIIAFKYYQAFHSFFLMLQACILTRLSCDFVLWHLIPTFASAYSSCSFQTEIWHWFTIPKEYNLRHWFNLLAIACAVDTRMWFAKTDRVTQNRNVCFFQNFCRGWIYLMKCILGAIPFQHNEGDIKCKIILAGVHIKCE